MTSEYAKHSRRFSMENEAASTFLDEQIRDLQSEVITERGGHPQEATHTPAYEQERQLTPLEDVYRIGLRLHEVRSQVKKAA